MTVPVPAAPFADHSDGQAMKNAEAVIEALEIVPRSAETVGYPFVADHHGPSFDQKTSAGTQYLRGVGHVM
jgi:hypothetical protein